MSDYIEIANVQITHPNKILFPQENLTKESIARYYLNIADKLLPYLHDRPLTLERYPDGIGKRGFYQKQSADYYPDYIEQITLKNISKEGSTGYPLCQNARSLIYLIQLATITFHTWLSKKSTAMLPEYIVLDLDPPSKERFDLVRKSAFIIKETIENLGLKPFIMTTGSSGAHITIPIKPELTFDELRNIIKKIAEKIISKASNIMTSEIRKEKRNNKLYIDIARNAYGQTSVAPYTIRAKAGAPVATPLSWEELENKDLSSQKYNITNIFTRLQDKEDPWQNLKQNKVSIKDIKMDNL